MNSKVRDLVFMALYAALFAVLDIISNEFIPFLQMPEGGSIGTVSYTHLFEADSRSDS